MVPLATIATGASCSESTCGLVAYVRRHGLPRCSPASLGGTCQMDRGQRGERVSEFTAIAMCVGLLVVFVFAFMPVRGEQMIFDHHACFGVSCCFMTASMLERGSHQTRKQNGLRTHRNHLLAPHAPCWMRFDAARLLRLSRSSRHILTLHKTRQTLVHACGDRDDPPL